MSPRRRATGRDTAAASRVAVITHPAFEPDVCSRSGSSLWIGITIVGVRAALSPPKQRATTATTGLGDGVETGDVVTGAPEIGTTEPRYRLLLMTTKWW